VASLGLVSPFSLSDFVCPLFFVNSATIFFPSGVTLRRVSPGAARPPPSDATGLERHCCKGTLHSQSGKHVNVNTANQVNLITIDSIFIRCLHLLSELGHGGQSPNGCARAVALLHRNCIIRQNATSQVNSLTRCSSHFNS